MLLLFAAFNLHALGQNISNQTTIIKNNQDSWKSFPGSGTNLFMKSCRLLLRERYEKKLFMVGAVLI
jgi:hypothetical protein